MKLSHSTWVDVDRRLKFGAAIMLPCGSTEQHGPMGMIGTDTLCADAVADAAASHCNCLVAPALAYTPAPFNTAFAGTVSLSEDMFEDMVGQVIGGLLDQGFAGVFVVNGHGANVAPVKRAMARFPAGRAMIQSWWEPTSVKALRKSLYGDWEGMHATPSEIAITQHLYGVLSEGEASQPPQKLDADFIEAHKGDKHGPPDEHRAQFPDGRVGSHSALARPEHGEQLLKLAGAGIAEAFQQFETAARAL